MRKTGGKLASLCKAQTTDLMLLLGKAIASAKD